MGGVLAAGGTCTGPSAYRTEETGAHTLGTSTGLNIFTTRDASYMLMLMDMSSCIHTPLASLVLPTFLSLLVELQLEHRAVVQRLDGSAIVVHTLHLAQRLAEALDLGLHRHRRGG